MDVCNLSLLFQQQLVLKYTVPGKMDRFGDKISPDCKFPLENPNPKMISNWDRGFIIPISKSSEEDEVKTFAKTSRL